MDNQKKAYQKPRITGVELVSDISAKSGCKTRTSGQNSKNDKNCNVGGSWACKNTGS